MLGAVLLSLALVSTWLPWTLAQRHGILPLVSPLHFVAYLAGLGVLLKTVVFLIEPDAAFFSIYVNDQGSILLGYAYLTGFVLSLCLGYVLAVRKRPDPDFILRLRQSLLSVRIPTILAVLSVGIFMATALSILSARGIYGLTSLFSIETLYQVNTQKIVRIEGEDNFGQSFAALKLFFIVPTFAMTVWLARHLNRPSFQTLMMTALMITLVIFITIFQAKRLELLELIFYFLCIYIMSGRRPSIKLAVGIGAAGVLMFALFVVMTVLRATKGGLENAEIDLLGPLTQITSSTYFLDINMAVIMVERVRFEDLFLGDSYFYWTFAWIPRALWEGKPVITLGPYVKQEILGVWGSIGGINPTGPGEAYLNFGFFGVLVGLVLGWIYRKLEMFFLGVWMLRTKIGAWLYILTFLSFVMSTLQSSFSASAVTFVAGMLVLTVVLKTTTLNIRVTGPPARMTGAAVAIGGRHS